MAMSSAALVDHDDYREEGDSHALRRVVTSVLIGAAFMCGLGSGLLADGTSETLLAYRAEMPRYRMPTEAGAASSATTLDRTRPVAVVASAPERAMTTMMTDAWFPDNNTMTWDIGLAPGQSLSGLSVRNSDSANNMIATLYVLAADGRWIRAGLLHVRAGHEAVVHPPVGSYAMTYTTVARTTPYASSLNRSASRVVYFDLADPETAGEPPQTRFASVAGTPKRLPDLDSYSDDA